MKRLGQVATGTPVAEELFDHCMAMTPASWPVAADLWQPEIGATLKKATDNKPLEAALQALFSLHALRVAGSWSVELDVPMRVSMAGHVFDLHGRIEVHGGVDALDVNRMGVDSAPLQFAWGKKGWRLAGDHLPDRAWRYAMPTFLEVDGFTSSYVQSWQVPSSYQPGNDLTIDWPRQLIGDDGIRLAGGVANQMSQVMQLFEKIGPNYVSWCKPVFRGIAACASYHPDRRISASFSMHAGIISAAFPLTTAFLAEILVHELSHQYFLMLCASIPLIRKQNDETLFYSSLKKKSRPLKMIFFAFHATTNMALFWHDMLSVSNSDHNLASKELAKLLRHSESLGETISASGALTDAGETMFDCLRTSLRERDLQTV